MHQRQRAQHACAAIRGEAEPSQGESDGESEGMRPAPCIRGAGGEPSMHAQPCEERRSLSHVQRSSVQHACKAIRGEAGPSQGEGKVRPDPCITGSEPSMHTQPYETEPSQGGGEGVRHEPCIRGGEPSMPDNHTSRGGAKPRRERGGEASAMSKGVRSEPCIRGSEPRLHTQPYEARRSQAKARTRRES